MKTNGSRFVSLRAVVALSSALGVSSAQAVNGTWTNTSTGAQAYEATGNWSGGTVAEGAGSTGIFQVGPGGNQIIRFNTANITHTLGIMQTGNTNGRSQTFAGVSNTSATEKLILDNGGSAATITELASHGNNTYFYLPILLNSSLDIFNLNTGNRTLNFHNAASITNNTANALTITNRAATGNSSVFLGVPISDGVSNGSLSVVQNSSVSALILAAAHTHSGTTKSNLGSLQLTNLSAIQNSALDTTGVGTVTAGAGAGNYVIGGLISGRNLASVVTGTPTNVTTLTLNPGTGKSHTYSDVIGDLSTGMTLTKTGDGTQVLSGTNTYTGPTFINGGTLRVASPGSLHASSALTVGSLGTLSGDGTINGLTTVNGTHSPGNSPGVMTHAANLTYNAGANVNWELVGNTNASRGTNYDGIDLTGLANLDFSAASTNLNLSFNTLGSAVLWSDAFWSTSHTGTNGWLVYDVAAGATSNVSNLALATIDWADSGSNLFNSARPGSTFSLTQIGNDIYLNYNFVAIPEPGTMALASLGLIGLIRLVPRRKCRGG